MLKITARSIVEELEKRGVQTEVLVANQGLFRYRTAKDQWHILRSCTDMKASWLGDFVARNKQITEKLLQGEGLSMPTTQLFEDELRARQFLDRYKQIVVKPTDGSHGNGVTIGVAGNKDLSRAIGAAKENSPSGTVLLQEQVMGTDVRILIIGGLYAAAAIRLPAHVVGDGTHTIRALIDLENADSTLRSKEYSTHLHRINPKAAEDYLGARIDTEIPEPQVAVQVSGPANIGAGGSSVNVTDKIPKQMIKKAEQIARKLSLPTCGVDFIAADISRPEGYRFIEINACPSFGLHLYPTEGEPVPVDRMFVDYLMEQLA